MISEEFKKDFTKYEGDEDPWTEDGLTKLVKDKFDRVLILPFEEYFEEYSAHLQILLNILWKYKSVRIELKKLSQHIADYFDDFPILSMKLKIYKTKPPQIIPSTSKFFDEQIENTLGLLETAKYGSILEHFEEGLKEFLIAKSKAQLKNTVEDM